MTKPFFPDELLARVKAQLRRNSEQMVLKEEDLTYQNIVFEANSGIVKIS
jgi:DNA-binding response OmpR family regulator